jgi:hypothetical protein
VLRDHLDDLAARIGFRRELHQPRYAAIDVRLREKREDLSKRLR